MKPPATPASPAKRTREANGRKEKVEEPSTKKKKIEAATPTSKPAPRVRAYNLRSLFMYAVRAKVGGEVKKLNVTL